MEPAIRQINPAAASISVAAPSVDREDYAGIEAETDPARIRWRTLRMALQEYRKLRGKNTRGADECSLRNLAIASVLHLQGRSETPDPRNRLPTKRQDEYYLVCDGEAFMFSAVEFPEYHHWMEFNLQDDAYRAAMRTGKGWNGPQPVFDASTYAWLEALAESTLEAWAARYPQCQ